MYYEVFPFGKYKGVKLTELPSTYIVLALEKFELPVELQQELYLILLGKITAFSKFKIFFSENTKKDIECILNERINHYEL